MKEQVPLVFYWIHDYSDGPLLETKITSPFDLIGQCEVAFGYYFVKIRTLPSDISFFIPIASEYLQGLENFTFFHTLFSIFPTPWPLR